LPACFSTDPHNKHKAMLRVRRRIFKSFFLYIAGKGIGTRGRDRTCDLSLRKQGSLFTQVNNTHVN
jgi:hypothetical protein